MFRLSGLFSLAIAGVFGTLLFWASQSVQRAEKNLSQVSFSLSHENESLRVLSAEWDYLNRPQRLEKLAKENFDLDDDKAKENIVVEDARLIPVPAQPVLPGVKPKNLMQYISTEQKLVPKSENSVIANPDRQEFDKLLSGVVSEGQQ